MLLAIPAHISREEYLQNRKARAGMCWKPSTLLHVLALRLAKLNATLWAFWANRGLLIAP
jgi:hypothetical protein